MLTDSPLPIAIAGTGRVAQALGRLLAERGEPVTAVAGRNPERARAAAVFIGHKVKPVTLGTLPKRTGRLLIAVSDSSIPEVARLIAGSGMKQGIALHTCGAMGPEALAPLAAAGVSCGALHPLQTFATPEQGLSALTGCTFGIDGNAAALQWAMQIAHLLDAATLRVPPEGRLLYHAAAVMAGNYVVALVDAAAMLMNAAGIEPDEALRALGPLVEASVGNALHLGTVEALTGPVQRGDIETISGHLSALRRAPESVQRLYRAAGLHTVGLAVRGGLAPDRARLLENLFQESDRGNG
jgi:predicted short-subunit dehydrogenase-like oxidoreductase (DUF2520 family)